MELPLEKLDGAMLSEWTLAVRVERAGGAPFPVTIEARHGKVSCPALVGRTSPGTAWRWPWLEARFHPCIEAHGRREGMPGGLQEAFFERLGYVLVPGSYVMLSCDGHPETLRALAVGVPSACTPLGYLLWRAGARWYKPWYYSEGWREGHEKLQGNVPPNDGHLRKAESERLAEAQVFLDGDLAASFPGCAEIARSLLEATRVSRKA